MSSEPAIVTDASWLCGLLQSADSFYPTGSYAHSLGLEGLVQVGCVRDRAGLREYLWHSVLPGLRQAELPVAAHAWRALGTEPVDWARIGELCVLADAQRTSAEVRAASQAIGRQRIELLVSLRQHPLATSYLARAAEAGWPCCAAVAAALEGRAFGVPLAGVLAGMCYTALAGAISAAMKLLRLGQQAAQSLLVELLVAVGPIVELAQQVPIADIGWFNPWLDIASARHATADFRLFIS